jgi:hypothetical protein
MVISTVDFSLPTSTNLKKVEITLVATKGTWKITLCKPHIFTQTLPHAAIDRRCEKWEEHQCR